VSITALRRRPDMDIDNRGSRQPGARVDSYVAALELYVAYYG
jgi:hypothetical protein